MHPFPFVRAGLAGFAVIAGLLIWGAFVLMVNAIGPGPKVAPMATGIDLDGPATLLGAADALIRVGAVAPCVCPDSSSQPPLKPW
jgi:hypothetical protein